uniref:UBX domain-containing protein n=1 Tax=Aureoumbra lagunensis TaxID=44058 RepID=A0A7S3NIK1_9STRA|mmetsp:Transcript_13877/g.18526  ORF Transcript_13877/g.18526 Transcript_13877/m.18526 type:complete len:222 (+) Transcript_13877:87-752(+)
MIPPQKPSRRGSFSYSGYDGLVRCNLEIETCAIPSELNLNVEDKKLAKKQISQSIDDDALTLCRRELGRLEEERRLEEEEKKEREEKVRITKVRKEREEAEARAQNEKLAREAAEREREAIRERERKEKLERARAQEEALRLEFEQQEAERQERIRLDESFAQRLNNEFDSHPSPSDSHDVEKLARLTALTGADEQTCRFYLDCASGDVSAAFRFWEQSTS